MPESASQAQRSLFAAALAYKEGRTSDAEVTSNIRQIADETSIEDLRALAGTDPEGLPYKVGGGEQNEAGEDWRDEGGWADDDPEWTAYRDSHPNMDSDEMHIQFSNQLVRKQQPPTGERQIVQGRTHSFGETSMPDSQQNEKQMNIGDLVAQYTKFGKVFQREPMVMLAQQLSQLADGVEVQLGEDTNDWYDKHTIGRNVKEMKSYAKEFEKLAQEADEFNTRMQALYQDMGRVLERYFDVYDPADKGGEMLAEPGTNMAKECGSTCRECGSPMHESCNMSGDAITMRALPIIRKKLTEASRIIFDRLSPDMKRKVIWRLI